MSPVIDQQLEAVQQLCRRHHVARLELFGSAANGNFDSTESDLDFLVEFEPLSPSDRADAYFGLLATLQDLFGREIDLVEVEAVTNPYFLQSLAATRKVLYAA
jgi:predicted nucleotidyltransferase